MQILLPQHSLSRFSGNQTSVSIFLIPDQLIQCKFHQQNQSYSASSINRLLHSICVCVSSSRHPQYKQQMMDGWDYPNRRLIETRITTKSSSFSIEGSSQFLPAVLLLPKTPNCVIQIRKTASFNHRLQPVSWLCQWAKIQSDRWWCLTFLNHGDMGRVSSTQLWMTVRKRHLKHLQFVFSPSEWHHQPGIDATPPIYSLSVFTEINLCCSLGHLIKLRAISVLPIYCEVASSSC